MCFNSGHQRSTPEYAAAKPLPGDLDDDVSQLVIVNVHRAGILRVLHYVVDLTECEPGAFENRVLFRQAEANIRLLAALRLVRWSISGFSTRCAGAWGSRACSPIPGW